MISNLTEEIMKLLEVIYKIEYYEKIDVFKTATKINEHLKELERLARIGKATEKAYSKGAFLIYDVVENYDGTIERYNCDETIEELLVWLEFTESEE